MGWPRRRHERTSEPKRANDRGQGRRTRPRCSTGPTRKRRPAGPSTRAARWGRSPPRTSRGGAPTAASRIGRHATTTKHSSGRGGDESVWWAPRRASWWIGVFAIGSTCFFVGPFPGFVELVGSAADGLVFFVGSIFFTSAAALPAPRRSTPTRAPRRVASGFGSSRGSRTGSTGGRAGSSSWGRCSSTWTFHALQEGSTRTSTTDSSGRRTRSAPSLPRLRLPRGHAEVSGGYLQAAQAHARVVDCGDQPARVRRVRDLRRGGVLGPRRRGRARPRGRERVHGVRRPLFPRRSRAPPAGVGSRLSTDRGRARPGPALSAAGRRTPCVEPAPEGRARVGPALFQSYR